MLQLPLSKYTKFRSAFFKQVMALPAEVTMIQSVVTPDVGTTAYDKFTGNQPRVKATYKVKCLYRRDFSFFQRQKYGLSEDCSAMIWIPPEELLQIMGTFKPNWNTFIVKWVGDQFNEEEYVIDRVVNRAPLYGTCIAVELHLKTSKKA